MALPHDVQMQLIKKRLRGKEGKTKLKEIEAIRLELPGWNTGPYGKIKKWLTEQAEKTKTRSKIKHQDYFAVKKQGLKQFVLVGCPSVGKSSLINKMSGLQTKIAAYEFTTLKPIPGVISVNSAEIQIVDLPGLVEGASEDVGQGKRMLGIVRSSDGVLLMHDLTKPIADVEKMVIELEKARIEKKMIIIGNKLDIGRENLRMLRKHFPERIVVGISTVTGEGLEELKKEIWEMSELIRVYPRREERPMILSKGSTVKDFAEKVHRELKVKGARISGKSARFPRQMTGLDHELADEDEIELVIRR